MLRVLPKLRKRWHPQIEEYGQNFLRATLLMPERYALYGHLRCSPHRFLETPILRASVCCFDDLLPLLIDFILGMWIYSSSKPVFKRLIRLIAEVRHPVFFSKRLSSCHALLNSPFIPGNSSPSSARRYTRRAKIQLDLFQTVAKEEVVDGRQLPVRLTQKRLTTSAIKQDSTPPPVGKVLDQMTVCELNEKDGRHRAFIALGSNMGDRLKMIERACKLLEQSGEVSILRTSSLWETKAMYFENQTDFLNGVCEVEALCILVEAMIY